MPPIARTTSSTSTSRLVGPTATRGRRRCCGSGSPTAYWSATTSRRSPSTARASPMRWASPRDLVGVIGALEVVDEGAGGVLPHERTTPKASTDRLDLTRATRANLSPVWGLSLAAGLTGLLQEPGELVGEVTVDGVVHRVERVTTPSESPRSRPRSAVTTCSSPMGTIAMASRGSIATRSATPRHEPTRRSMRQS